MNNLVVSVEAIDCDHSLPDERIAAPVPLLDLLEQRVAHFRDMELCQFEPRTAFCRNRKAVGPHLGSENRGLYDREGSTFFWCVLPMAIMAIGEVSWDYRNLIPPLASEFRGMQGAKSARSECSNPVRFGRFASFLINTDGFAIGRFFDLAIDSKLRGCDMVKIRINDIVCDRKIRTRATVVSKRLEGRS